MNSSSATIGHAGTGTSSRVEFPIHLRNVTRRFGDQVAVNDLTLSVRRGTTLGFIGINGAGKTTTIRMMVGLLAPDEGTVMIDGYLIPQQRDGAKAHFGYVPERPHSYPWMRVDEMIAFTRAFYPHWNDARCQELMKMFQLDPRKKSKHLSKGQAAKLSLLLAICHDPPVLILDEPTSGLDPLVREEFLEAVLASTSERQQTVLFSSHTLSDVQRLADTIALIHQGRLLVHSPVDDLIGRTKRIRAVLEDESAPRQLPTGFVWQQVHGREWIITVRDFASEQVEFVRARNRVAGIDVQDLTLDDVFKDFVRGQMSPVSSPS